MARELVWLENRNFVAWGCSNCNWIVAGSSYDSDRPSQEVKEAFNQHDCAEFSPRERKGSNT
jgi:ribosomal protein L37AE/L43A